MTKGTQQESRVKKTLLNARVNMIFYFMILILSFFSRKIFLDTLGADFIGLTGTMQNLLGFLNLAELGIATAIGYVLYAPLHHREQTKINEIISVLGYLYRRIGTIILFIGITVSLFLPLIFPQTGFNLSLLYFAYYSFLTSSLIGYFCNYKQTLLGADQRNYIVTAYFQGSNILKTLIQISIAFYAKNYYVWILIELSFGIIYSFILNWKINQTYPWLRSEVKQGKLLLKKYPEVMRYTKQLFVQKLSSIVQWQTTPFLTYAFCNLQTVAFYGNYTIITDKLSQFVNTFLESTGAGVGNLIAEGNKENIKKVFWELLCIRYFIGATIAFCIYMLINPFIKLWLGNQYLLSDTVLILIVANVLISYTRGGVMQFLYGYGLFKDVWAPIAEVIINLGTACTAGYIWGLPGVLIGGILSQLLIVNIWKPYFLFHEGFKESVLTYWIGLFKILLQVAAPMFLVYALSGHIATFTPPVTWIGWIGYSVVIFIMYAAITFVLMYIFANGFRTFILRFIKKR